MTFHACCGSFLTGSTSPKRPYRVSSLTLFTAVVTNTLSPQTTGLECESPGIGVFQRTLSDVEVSHFTGLLGPSATPVAFGPRNCGQFCACAAVTTVARQIRASISRFMVEPRDALVESCLVPA